MNLRQTLLSGLSWMMILNIIVKPLWLFGIEVGVQNAVGAESYGLYFALFNVAYVFNILLDLGVTNYNTRNIAQDPQQITQNLPQLLVLKLLLLLFYLSVTLTIGFVIGYQSHQFWLLVIICINQFLNSLILYLRSNFQGLLLLKWDSILSVLDRILMIIICGTLLLHTNAQSIPFHIEWFVLAQTAAYVFTTAIAVILLLKRIHTKELLRSFRFSLQSQLKLLRKGLPFALLVLLMASYNRLDPILLSRLSPLGNTDAGIYAGAFRLLDALSMVAYLVSVPLLPIFSKLTAPQTIDNSPDYPQLTATTKTAFSLIMVFAIASAIILSTFSEPLMQLLYHDNAESIARVFRLLVFDIIPISFTYIFGTLLTAGGHLKTLNWLASGTLLFSLIANLVAIPIWGPVGSAIASLTAQSFMAITQTIIAIRHYHLKPSASYILKLIVFTLFITGLCLVIAPL